MNTKKEMKPKISKRKEKELKTYNKKLSVFLAIFLLFQALIIIYFVYLSSNMFSQQELLYKEITVDEKKLERNYTLPLGRGRGSYLVFEIVADESRYVFPNVLSSQKNYSPRELDAMIHSGDTLTVVCSFSKRTDTYKVYAAYTETEQYRSLDYWKNEGVSFWCSLVVYEIFLLVVFWFVWFLFFSKGNPFIRRPNK